MCMWEIIYFYYFQLETEEHDNGNKENAMKIAESLPMELVRTLMIMLLNYFTSPLYVKGISTEVMKHVKAQQLVDKTSALDLIDINSKSKRLQIIRQYTSHYLLGLKVRKNGGD